MDEKIEDRIGAGSPTVRHRKSSSERRYREKMDEDVPDLPFPDGLAV